MPFSQSSFLKLDFGHRDPRRRRRLSDPTQNFLLKGEADEDVYQAIYVHGHPVADGWAGRRARGNREPKKLPMSIWTDRLMDGWMDG